MSCIHNILYDPEDDANELRRLLTNNSKHDLFPDLLYHSGSAFWIVLTAAAMEAGIKAFNRTSTGKQLHQKRRQLQAHILNKVKELLGIGGGTAGRMTEATEKKFTDNIKQFSQNYDINGDTINVKASTINGLAELIAQQLQNSNIRNLTPDEVQKFLDKNGLSNELKWVIELDNLDTLSQYAEYVQKHDQRQYMANM